MNIFKKKQETHDASAAGAAAGGGGGPAAGTTATVATQVASSSSSLPTAGPQGAATGTAVATSSTTKMHRPRVMHKDAYIINVLLHFGLLLYAHHILLSYYYNRVS
jgi:hypothetical protein